MPAQFEEKCVAHMRAQKRRLDAAVEKTHQRVAQSFQIAGQQARTVGREIARHEQQIDVPRGVRVAQQSLEALGHERPAIEIEHFAASRLGARSPPRGRCSAAGSQ